MEWPLYFSVFLEIFLFGLYLEFFFLSKPQYSRLWDYGDRDRNNIANKQFLEKIDTFKWHF